MTAAAVSMEHHAAACSRTQDSYSTRYEPASYVQLLTEQWVTIRILAADEEIEVAEALVVYHMSSTTSHQHELRVAEPMAP